MVNHLGIITIAVYDVISKGGVWTNEDIYSELGSVPKWIVDESIVKLENNQQIENVSIGSCYSDFVTLPNQWVIRQRPAD